MTKKNKYEKIFGYAELRNLDGINEDEMRIRGIAAVYEQPTVLYECEGVQYKEVIERGAFDNADFSDCCLKYNHNVPIMARVRGGSLSLEIDDNVGLKFEAKLFNTTTSRDLYQIIKEKGIDKCSFAFTVVEDEYDRATHTRKIKKIGKVFDVSIVDIPAYDQTEVSARSKFFEAEADKNYSLENDKRKRMKLKLMLDI